MPLPLSSGLPKRADGCMAIPFPPIKPIAGSWLSVNPWGFVLADEEQAWPGGLGSGLTNWHPVAVEQVPTLIRQRLEWILEEDE